MCIVGLFGIVSDCFVLVTHTSKRFDIRTVQHLCFCRQQLTMWFLILIYTFFWFFITTCGSVGGSSVLPSECSDEATHTCLAKMVPPIIDVSILSLSNSTDRQEVITKIGMAARTWGFFHIVNHGISQVLINTFREQMKFFFELPSMDKRMIKRQVNNSRGFADDELTKQKVDMKEIFDVGSRKESDHIVLDGFNQWPAETMLPNFRTTIETYYDACEIVAARILQAMSEDLGIDNTILIEAFKDHSSFLRLNMYPVINDTRGQVLGISRHTDAGILTLLLQDMNSALEVYSGSKEDRGDGEWVPVEPVVGAITINTGDMLQIYSNDAYKAPEHRVKASTQQVRYSAPFFYNPRYDAVIEPLNTGTRKSLYRKLTWGEFRSMRFQGDYADKGQEVQIEDYKTA